MVAAVETGEIETGIATVVQAAETRGEMAATTDVIEGVIATSSMTGVEEADVMTGTDRTLTAIVLAIGMT
jgi:hypothetical protein